ncbi:hypothetical protein EMCRGX_G026616 [Ephydatia muelleri]
MNLGGIYQLDKDTDASFQDGSDKEDDDTSVESDSSSVDDTDLAAGAILVPDFKNNPDQDDIFATPWGKEHYLKYFPRQTRPLIAINANDINSLTICGAYWQLQKVNANWPLENLLDVVCAQQYST